MNFARLKKHFKQINLIHFIILFVLFWVPVVIFAKLANEVIERESLAFDPAILTWLNSIGSPVLDTVAYVVTSLANAETIIAVTAIIIGLLIYKKQYSNAVVTAAIIGGAALGNYILKLSFQRPRPTMWDSIITETGYSFPSGHAMLSTALALCVIYLLWQTRWRLLSIILGAIFIVAVGLSRLYFGVHYPTDIIAGWCVSAAWVALVISVSHQKVIRLFKPHPSNDVA